MGIALQMTRNLGAIRHAAAALATSVAMAACAAALAQPVPQAAVEHVPDTVEARVMACVPCHGPRGQGIANVSYPRLAGKPAGYLTNQLVAFRDGRRKYTPMNYLLAYRPDDDLRRMGAYYAEQREP